MIKLRMTSIAKELGIVNLYSHLRKHGISRHHATQLTQDRLNKFDTKLLFRLCLAFNCHLNDLFEYVPTNDQERQRHAFLEPMVSQSAPMDVNQELKQLNTDKRKQVIELLKQLAAE